MMKKLLIALAIVSGPAFAAQGLNGTYYNPAADTTANFQDNFAETITYLASNPQAAGTFTATNLNYSGGDASSIVNWLGTDGSTFAGTNGNMSDGVISLKGWINLSAGESLSVSHDDGFQVLLDGTTIAKYGCCGTTGVGLGSATGWHAVEIDYNNALYGNYSGGAYFTVYANGSVISAADLSTTAPVPEAGSGAMVLAGLGLLGLVARRRARK